MKNSNRNALKYLFIAGTFTFVFYIFGYFLVRNSDAYSVAIIHINESDVFKNIYGDAGGSFLVPYGFSMHTDGFDGKARLQIFIEGSKKSGRVAFFLERRFGKWSVERSISLPEWN